MLYLHSKLHKDKSTYICTSKYVQKDDMNTPFHLRFYTKNPFQLNTIGFFSCDPALTDSKKGQEQTL